MHAHTIIQDGKNFRSTYEQDKQVCAHGVDCSTKKIVIWSIIQISDTFMQISVLGH